jgi:hypothetical protein
MADIFAYESKLVNTSKSILLEVFTLLNEYKDHLVLVGGWVPFLLLEKYKPVKIDFQHVGSIDIDIALNHRNLPGLDEVYESIREKLEKSSYKTRKSKDGQDIPHSLEKEFQGTFIHIDFLASESGGTGKGHRHQRVQGLLAIKSNGVDLAFQNKEVIHLEGILPNGASHAIDINIAGVVAMITMKSYAYDSAPINRIKDVYDIYAVLKYYKNGVESIIKEAQYFNQDNLFLEATQKLGNFFTKTNSLGPIGLADFILPEAKGSEDWEFYRRDIYELVEKFLRSLK